MANKLVWTNAKLISSFFLSNYLLLTIESLKVFVLGKDVSETGLEFFVFGFDQLDSSRNLFDISGVGVASLLRLNLEFLEGCCLFVQGSLDLAFQRGVLFCDLDVDLFVFLEILSHFLADTAHIVRSILTLLCLCFSHYVKISLTSSFLSYNALRFLVSPTILRFLPSVLNILLIYLKSSY